MTEAWEIKADDNRSSDGLALYLIFCEDEVSETVYFKSFPETKRHKINVIGSFYSKQKHVTKVIEHCINNNYICDKDGVLGFEDDLVRVWCVYDNDLYIEKQVGYEKLDFRISVETAERYGLNVAWSNDAFELWILLHFEEINVANLNHSRSSYYAELDRIFESPARESELLGKRLVGRAFSYKYYLKSKKGFTEIVLPVIKEKTDVALLKAKQIFEEHVAAGRLSCDIQVPCTKVFMLVEELVSLKD